MSEQSNLIRFALLKKEAGQDFSFHALGRSMRPFIPSGSEVMIRPASSCKRGDIALVRTHSTLVLHRVVDIQSDSLVLRGDWNTQHQIVPLSSDWRCHLLYLAIRARDSLNHPKLNQLWLFLCAGVHLRKRLFQPLSGVDSR